MNKNTENKLYGLANQLINTHTAKNVIEGDIGIKKSVHINMQDCGYIVTIEKVEHIDDELEE